MDESTRPRRRIKQFCNVQFYQTLNSDKRIKVHQGGTRSGKTYAICQYIIHKLITEQSPLTITIARKTLPSLKGSVMRDFLGILDQIGLLYVGTHNKAENTYSFKNHLVEFLSVDEPQKIRGRKRNICFINEANELDYEDYRQLLMRTTDEMILDFNPSDPIHWIYDEVCTREDCETFITTYKDNKFLPAELIKEIERLRERDPDYWNVYGLGQKAAFSKRQIFNNWQFIDESEFPPFDEIFYGLDFGFSNDPTAIVQVARVNDKLFVKELCYSTGMTNKMIYDFFIANGYKDELVYYDAAEPKSGEELRQLGLMGIPADKGQGSVNAGISLLKEFEIYVSNKSKNLFKEYETYYWTQLKDETIVNIPVDKNNHLIDGLRYSIYTKYKTRTEFFVF